MSEATLQPGSTNPASPHLSRRAWLLLLLYSATLFLFALGRARTLTGHEGHYAAVVQGMLRTGDWLVPRIGSEPWLEKPLLPHWCMAVAVWGGGMDEFVLRVPSILAGLLGVCIVASLAARWFGPTQGLLAGLIQATTLHTLTYARLAESDIFLWALVLACIWVFCQVHVEPKSNSQPRRARLAFFILLGATNLAKGLLFGAAIVLLPCLGFFVAGRRWRELRWFLYLPGIMIFVLLALGWPLAVVTQYPDALSLWSKHLLGRLAVGEGSMNPGPIWYYFATVPWQLLPWTPIALFGLGPSARRAWHEPAGADRFLWLWFVLPFAVLSLATGKHHHYLIHALPPFSFWAAEGLVRLSVWMARLSAQRVLVSAVAMLAVVTIALAAAGLVPADSRFGTPAVILGGLLLGGLAAGLACWLRGSPRGIMISLFALVWVVAAYVHAAILPWTDSYAEETKFLRRMAVYAAEGRPILVYQLEPSRVLLYCSADCERITTVAELRQHVEQQPDCVVIAGLGHHEVLVSAGELQRIDSSPTLPTRGREQMAAYVVEGSKNALVAR
jgi:4-amino-4-deoxy-L-arabinose transferase-like glycosyltransferase